MVVTCAVEASVLETVFVAITEVTIFRLIVGEKAVVLVITFIFSILVVIILVVVVVIVLLGTEMTVDDAMHTRLKTVVKRFR